MAEHPRQEIELSLDGQTFRVRPTWEVIAGIEADLNQPARTVGMKALAAGLTAEQRAIRNAGPEISMSEMAVALFWILRGKKGAPESPNAMGQVLMEDGYGDLLLPVGQFLVRAQRGNKVHEKEAAEAIARAKIAAKAAEGSEPAPEDPIEAP